MKIAVASGKGGTGKTTVSLNLALVMPRPVLLLDCDVEEPNCHLFLKPELEPSHPVGIPIPLVDAKKCTACGECSRICQFRAIVSLKTKPLIFPELCHGCGGCAKICPTGAITEIQYEIGVVESGRRGALRFVQGRLLVGHPMSPPLIRAVKQQAAGHEGHQVLDCPPGTSCPVITALRGAQFVVLVTEPTPFGLHDLTLAVETVRLLGLPCGVVINRADVGDGRVRDFCLRENIPVLLEIREDRKIAEAYSRGEILVEKSPEYRALFEQLWERIELAEKTSRMASEKTGS